MNARHLRWALAIHSLACAFAVLPAACLDRPVVAGEPTTQTNFTTTVATKAVNKIDLLFDIDNSASMGDKQSYLELAIPDLIKRLVTPNCLDAGGNAQAAGTADASGNVTCPDGQQLEFPAVHDLHIGILSSSLGARGGDKVMSADGSNGGECVPGTPSAHGYPTQYDDEGHLLSRASIPGPTVATDDAGVPIEAPLADGAASPSGFLAWLPAVSQNAGLDAGAEATLTSAPKLEADFADLVAGVGEYGCGIESQLETWYRFLVQPDPYASIDVQPFVLGATPSPAKLVGVDQTILKERHDFLRPDSLVAVIVLSDENDSEIDVRTVGAQGYLFMATNYPPPHGTSACAKNPADPACQTCQPGSTDPACASRYTAVDDWGNDLNLRHVHMKEKYGLDLQFPIGRYVNGLTSAKVPDRAGEYPPGANYYVGTNDCTNPLFAASLPDGTSTDPDTLCNLPVGQRQASLVFYAHIGGVPHQLLPDPVGGAQLGASDWKKILGNDPENYDYSGIDPHMVESYMPRNGGAFDPTNALAATSARDLAPPTVGPDPISGREWITDGLKPGGGALHANLAVDRQYACIFPLSTPRLCDSAHPENAQSCDCASTGLTHDQTSPVCDDTNPNQQNYAKAYPTVRELLLAKKLGKQGVVSSICPIHISDNAAGTDPLYGYRPAVASIVNRLKGSLTNECLPQHLDPDVNNQVQCLILVTLATPGGESACNAPGLAEPDAATLARFRATLEDTWVKNGGAASGPDPATLPVCVVNQLPKGDLDGAGSCKDSSDPGWCYVSGAAAGSCAQSIVFSPTGLPTGASANLQCIESSVASVSHDAGP